MKRYALLLFTLLACPVSADPLQPELIEILKDSHAGSCTTTVEPQLSQADYDNVEARALAYCGCLSEKYFDDFTVADFEEMSATSGQLPARKTALRSQFQQECATLHL